jgi:Zinc dependent phospholipase C
VKNLRAPVRILRSCTFSTILCLLLLACPRPAGGYSVLTHEEMIDLTWADSIRPLLLKRYPTLTNPQLREARAYAYGGCVIQDLGYYPFGKPIFSELLHYVRTGDFVSALFRDSKGPDDVAFAIGALAHYLGDTIGHPEAVNVAVGTGFPALAVKYGPNVNYAEGPREHVRTEFAFDINEITNHRVAPLAYLDHVGFAVPVPLLTRAFYDTYGLDLAKVLGTHRPTLKGYRFAVRSFLPRVAYAEVLLHRKHMPPDVSSPALDEFNTEVAALSAADHWPAYRGHAGFGTHLLAGLILILPKVGTLADLAIKGPSPAAEQDYVNSVMRTETVFREILAQASHPSGVGNKDLDTGNEVFPGTYPLEDYAYANLLHQMTRDPSSPIPSGIKHDLLIYFADMSKAKYIQADKRRLAQVEADLPILQTISTKAAYPESAFLPEPDEDKPDPTVPRPASLAPNPKPAAPATPKPQP